MSLRWLLDVGPTAETVQELVLAAEQRYWEAFELFAAGQPFAAIYLAGYSAEMLLKSAVFYFDGAKPADAAVPRLIPIRQWARGNVPGVADESFHSIAFWSAVLTQKRIDAGRTLAPGLAADLSFRASRTYAAWWIEMRYRSGRFSGPVDTTARIDVLTLLEDVDWLMKHHTELWS